MKLTRALPLLLLLVACPGGPENRVPQVNSFAVTVSSGRSVNFNWSASDADGDALTCSLDTNNDGTPEFNNLNCAAGTTQAFTYGANGTYTARLKVSDARGGTASSTTGVSVTAVVNNPPVISSLTQTTSGLNVTLNWAVSDPEGNPLTCAIDWGDASSETVACSPSSRAHAYAAAGARTAILTVSDNAGNTVNRSVSLSPGVSSSPGYNVTLLFDGSVADKYKTVFQASGARWQGIISGDLPDINGSVDTNTICGTSSDSVRIPGSVSGIDDVLILVGTFTEGPGGLLGFAGPCRLRASNGLTGVGQMKFDTADLDSLLNNGLLDETITHEMGHVLGIGTLWQSKGLVTGVSGNSSTCGNNPRYVGAKGVAEYKALGGPDATVPVEDQFGPGSCEGHWRESIFKKELMTSFLNSGSNPLSRLSIASLEDLGYSVNYGAAEVFALGGPVPDLRVQGIGTPQHSVLLPPSGVIDDTR